VELDVRADQVGGDVGQHRFRREAPEIGMAVDQRAEPPHMRPVGSMLGAKIERLVGVGHPAAFFQKRVRQLDEAAQPCLGDHARGGQKPGLEISPALRLAQHTRRMREDMLGCHCWPIYSASATAA